MTAVELDDAWMTEGACRDFDADLWFPEQGGNGDDAKAICARCPVRAKCIAYAVAADERYGVWGALSPNERLGTAPDVLARSAHVAAVLSGRRPLAVVR